MTPQGVPSNIEITDASATQSGGGCGCGGCGCGSNAETSAAPTTAATTAATTVSYAVTGMTCGHCVGAVTSELKALDGVTDVAVELVADGTSTVTVISDRPLTEAQVAEALDEAGDYQLA